MGFLAGLGGALAGSAVQGLFGADQASKNRAFQARMSKTAYQRAAADMDAAGLNRILALGGPASTPSGATAAISPPDPVGAGYAAATAKQQLANMKQTEKLLEAQTKSANAQATKDDVTKGPWEAGAPLVEEFLEGASNLINSARNVDPKEVIAEVGNTLKSGAKEIAKDTGSALKHHLRDRPSMAIGDFFDEWKRKFNLGRGKK